MSVHHKLLLLEDNIFVDQLHVGGDTHPPAYLLSTWPGVSGYNVPLLSVCVFHFSISNECMITNCASSQPYYVQTFSV